AWADSREGWERHRSHWQNRMERWARCGGGRGRVAASGNRGVDGDRGGGVKRPEEEGGGVGAPLARLCPAQDKDGVEQFMAERRNRPQGPTPQPGSDEGGGAPGNGGSVPNAGWAPTRKGRRAAGPTWAFFYRPGLVRLAIRSDPSKGRMQCPRATGSRRIARFRIPPSSLPMPSLRVRRWRHWAGATSCEAVLPRSTRTGSSNAWWSASSTVSRKPSPPTTAPAIR